MTECGRVRRRCGAGLRASLSCRPHHAEKREAVCDHDPCVFGSRRHRHLAIVIVIVVIRGVAIAQDDNHRLTSQFGHRTLLTPHDDATHGARRRGRATRTGGGPRRAREQARRRGGAALSRARAVRGAAGRDGAQGGGEGGEPHGQGGGDARARHADGEAGRRARRAHRRRAREHRGIEVSRSNDCASLTATLGTRRDATLVDFQGALFDGTDRAALAAVAPRPHPRPPSLTHSPPPPRHAPPHAAHALPGRYRRRARSSWTHARSP